MASKSTLKRILAIFLIVASIFVLPGCWDRKELEELALVLALGVDKSPSGGLLVTAQIAIPRQLGGQAGGGGGGGGAAQTTVITTVEAGSILSAMNLFNTYIGRRLSLMHSRALILGENFAKDPGSMVKVLGPLIRYRETRRIMEVIVTKGKAKDFLKNDQPSIDNNPGRYLEAISDTMRYTGLLPIARYQNFLTNVENPGLQPVAIYAASKPTPLKEAEKEKASAAKSYTAGKLPREGGEKVEFLGTAVFKDSHMVGALNGEETRIFNMIRGDFRRAFMTFPEPAPKQKNLVTIDLRQGSLPTVNVDTKGNKPKINIAISLEGELLGTQSQTNYATDLKKQKALEAQIRKVIHTRALALIKKEQQRDKADIFGFANQARATFLTWPEWTRYNWLKRFPEAEVHVKVDFRLRRVGLNFAPPASRRGLEQ